MFPLFVRIIEAEHGTLTPAQKNQLHQLVANTDFTKLRGDPEVATREVTKKYISVIFSRGYSSGFVGQPGQLEPPEQPEQPEQSVRQAYLTLDSFNRRTDEVSPTVYSWYYTEQRTTAAGFITSTLPISNIKSIRLYQPSLPKFAQLNSTNRLSVYFREFSTYAYMPTNSMPYHYMLRYSDSAISSRFVDSNLEEFNNGEFVFKTPITKLDTLSVSFGNPDQTIIFKPDRDTGYVSAYGAVTEITTSQPHNLVNGDVVYLSKFATMTPSYDAGINTQFGLVVQVTAVNKFTIQINTSAGSIWIANQPVVCFYAPFRVIMPIVVSF
jgi:hypothetical protein